MYVRLFSIVSPILICAAIGYVWARAGRPYDTGFVTRLITDVGMPFLIISSLSDAELQRGALAEVGLAAVCVLAAVGILGVTALRLLGCPLRSFLPSLMFPNTGNMGLPLCLFTFGQTGLSLGLVVFVVISITHFTLGVALVSGGNIFRQFLRNPIIYATVIGVILVLTGWGLPVWVKNTVDILAGLAIPLMLLTLGVSLASLKVQTFSKSLLFAGLRLGFGFAAGLLAARILGLDGVARGVVILQASMPVAVFNYLLAERYRRSPQEVAGTVVISTVLSLVTLPILLWFVLGR